LAGPGPLVSFFLLAAMGAAAFLLALGVWREWDGGRVFE